MAWMIPIMAANADRRHGEEDQLLASLIQQDAAHRYEFKILYGGPNAFRGQEHLRRALEQEAQAQWELAMKLDDARLVLRRPHDARSRDALRGGDIDPYRTELSSARPALLVLVVMAGVLGALFTGLLVARPSEPGSSESSMWVAIVIAIILVILLAKVALVRRR